MSDCTLMRESMPLLLTESLDPARRETAHQHIEDCAACGEEWAGYRETWTLLETLPEIEVPPRVKQQFMSYVNPQAEAPAANVVPFHRRPAAVARASRRGRDRGRRVVLRRASPRGADDDRHRRRTDARDGLVDRSGRRHPARRVLHRRVARAAGERDQPDHRRASRHPERQFTTLSNANDQIGVAFDITSHVTVTGQPTDKTMVRLMRYVLENEDRMSPARSRAIDWVRSTYSQPGNADPEIARALANVLRSERTKACASRRWRR